MKLNTLHILLLMLAGCFAACTDDITLPDIDDGGETVYTLRLTIEDVPQSRGINTVTVGGLKTHWCYGDVVTLSDGSKNYDFTAQKPDGKNIGDPVESNHAIFTYTGKSEIPHWTDGFTGTLTYKADATKDEKINIGYTSLSSIGIDKIPQRIINCAKYALQTANDNTDHLKCIEHLSASFENKKMSGSTFIAMRRNCSILKIVLDDIYYDLYGGSVLFVEGLKPVSGSTAKDIMAMVLGNGFVSEKGSNDKTNPNTYAVVDLRNNNPQNPYDDFGIEPFFKVSDNKRPFTGYAERDEDHKLVVYMPLFEEREVLDNEKIRVYIRDSWALDWYVWETAPLKPFKIKTGSVYTLDFTKKTAGRYMYESTAAIYIGHSHFYGLLGCNNLDAEKPTDVGNYYMFGNKTPIVCGESYPNPHGQATPFFFYEKKDDGKDYLGYNNPDGKIGLSYYEFSNPASYAGNNYLTEVKHNNSPKALIELWKNWLPQFNDFTSSMGTWSLAQSSTVFNNTVLKPIIVGQNGEETLDTTNPAGVNLRCRRTGHSIYLPISGILEPSEIDASRHVIAIDAKAQIKEGTEKYAMFPSQYLYLQPEANGKDVNLIEYVCDASKTKEITVKINNIDVPEIVPDKQRMYFNLYDAAPIRPSFWEKELNDIFKYIPGWTSN